jgi:hypothetical protein
VLEAQQHYYGRSQKVTPQLERDLLTEEEVAFIAQCDSFSKFACEALTGTSE